MPIGRYAPGTRAARAQAQYLDEGRRHLKRARFRYPSITDRAEALVTCVEDDHSVLTTRTVGLYRAQLGAMLRHLIPDDPVRLKRLLDRTEAALSRRRGRPAEPRTASRKVRDPAQAEVSIVLAELSSRVWRSPMDLAPAMLALTIYLHARLGHRPVEGETAQLDGCWLVLRNAKANEVRAGARERRIDLSAMHPLVRQATVRFIRLRERMIVQYGSYEAWYSAASEQLARICRRAGLRRLCLSAFRHVALATWKRAGLAPWTIAALAGHGSDLSAKRYYSDAQHGWAIEGLPRAEVIRVVLLVERARLRAERAQIRIATTREEVVEDELPVVPSLPPQPESRQVRQNGETGADYWRRWLAARPSTTFGSRPASPGEGADDGPETPSPIRR